MTFFEYDPPRPVCDDDIVRKGVRAFLAGNPNSDRTAPNEDEIVAAYSWLDDGYELARSLEGSYCYSRFNMKIVEWLDLVSVYVDRALEKAEREWADKNNILPPFPVATVVECIHGGNAHGVITGIYEHSPARYLIAINGVSDGSLGIVKYENCRLPQADRG